MLNVLIAFVKAFSVKGFSITSATFKLIFSQVLTVKYNKELLELQSSLVDLQNWIVKNDKKVCVVFEGRDAAGKGGAIKRFTEHLNPRTTRVVALSKPTSKEKGQWYFQRYIKELPNNGEIVFLIEVGIIEL